jgi:hypothetical protein
MNLRSLTIAIFIWVLFSVYWNIQFARQFDTMTSQIQILEGKINPMEDCFHQILDTYAPLQKNHKDIEVGKPGMVLKVGPDNLPRWEYPGEIIKCGKSFAIPMIMSGSKKH